MGRQRAATAAVTVIIAVAGLAACGGHATGAGGKLPHPGKSTLPPAAPPKPLKVESVKPHNLTGTDPLTVTFNATVTETAPLPTMKPKVPGHWSTTGTTAVFTPTRAYPPSTTIVVTYQKKAGAKTQTIATRTTPSGSLLRAQQILARLHYLPLTTTAPTLTDPTAEADAVYNPPKGTFHWRYSDTPSSLKSSWTVAGSSELLRGAVIAFQHDQDLPVDGLIGRLTWHSLIASDLANSMDPDKYSYVSANLHLPQTLNVWVEGKTALTSPVNGGVAGAPTPLGTFPIYERLTSTTMSGTNPDGSSYSDPGVPWVNYFSGGSAIHGFPRSSYGTPQSVGCLELPIDTAARVFPMLSYGTLVHVAGPKTSGGSGAPAPPSSSTPSPKPTKPTH